MSEPNREAVETVREVIRMHSSPTYDRGDAHGQRGQRGYIVWENQIEFITAALPHLIAAKNAEIAALRAEFNEVNSQLTEVAGMAFRYKALLNDALWWLRKHNRHADLRARIEKEFAPRAALDMSGGVK